MKSERRHELQENTLVKKLATMPSFSRTYGPRIFLGVILLVTVALVINYRMNNSAALLASVQKNLVDARENLQGMKNLEQGLKNLEFGDSQNARFIGTTRVQKFNDGIQAAKAVLDSADEKDAVTRSQALIYLGDLNWAMANAPELQGAATQPSMQPGKSTNQLLDDAENAYNDVVSKYPSQSTQVVAARFGLAAIAENRGSEDSSQWDKARTQYQNIIGSDAPLEFRKMAEYRLKELSNLQHPIIDLTPATLPSTTGPTTRSVLGPSLPAVHGTSTRPATTQPH